ncbi:MAG TPA: maleylacetoacetate isomerase [Legionellaceae bacterium]|nr:maleylacetoacetate isomerase [Legionellaceae bacterium]
MQLYDYYRSSCAYRVRIALALKALPYDRIPIDLTRDEHHATYYQHYNPQALIPTLIDAQHHLTQSLAIIEYLDESYPSPPLLPASPVERAQTRALALTIACDIHPLNNLRVLNALRKDWNANPEQIQRWYHLWLKEGFDAIEIQLSQYQRKQLFCFADQATLADICLIPQVYNAKRFEFSLAPYPTIEAIAEYCNTLPAFMDAYPRSPHDT